MADNSFNISGNIVDVVNRKIYKGELFIENGVIVKISEHTDVPDIFILPGIVDAHVHIESSMLTPQQFARLAVKHGTVATVSDPHEIANVLGIEGVNFMINDALKAPFKFYFGVPSCVPATSFETSGFALSSTEVNTLLNRNDFKYLSEMMNFPGVIYDDSEVMEKLASAKNHSKPIDGHAPGINGKDLEKYARAGITTDHESSSYNEAVEKIKLGIKLQIREGSAAKNFDALIPVIKEYPNAVMFCTDDCHPDDLVEKHILHLVKRGINMGFDLFNLLRAATYNPKQHYHLDNGLLQKGDKADFLVVSNLSDLNVISTYIDGLKVYDGNHSLIPASPVIPLNNFKCSFITEQNISLPVNGEMAKVIVAIDGDLYTKFELHSPKVLKGKVVSDIERDILKIIVYNRYKQSDPVVGLIKNFGLKKGAIAGSIAHDSHNIIALGVDDTDIVSAINEVIKMKGGIVTCSGNEISTLPLPVAGLMSDESGETVAKKYKLLNQKPKEWGCQLHAPFMTLSFMALLVIPELKIGDLGLFDVREFKLTTLFE